MMRKRKKMKIFAERIKQYTMLYWNTDLLPPTKADASSARSYFQNCSQTRLWKTTENNSCANYSLNKPPRRKARQRIAKRSRALLTSPCHPLFSVCVKRNIDKLRFLSAPADHMNASLAMSCTTRRSDFEPEWIENALGTTHTVDGMKTTSWH